MLDKLIVRYLGIKPYKKVLFKMQEFTRKRTKLNYDEIWLVQHPRVFTKGLSDKKNYILDCDIPIIQSDRGGKITFHDLGQQLIYILLDLHRRNLSIKKLIDILYNVVIYTLQRLSIDSYVIKDKPGIYVKKDKICSFGLRVHKGCTFHGLALNVSMNLSPFLKINPCGYTGLRMTQIKNLSSNNNIDMISYFIIKEFMYFLNINNIIIYYNLI